MFLAGIAFLGGVLLALQLDELPPSSLCLAVVVLSLALLMPRISRLPALFALGFCWLVLFSQQRLEQRLPDQLEGQTIVVSGQVVGLPESKPGRTRFLFAIDTVHRPPHDLSLVLHTRLNWYGTREILRAGDRWRLRVRLKQPHGFRNPGGFDYEAWLFRKGIRATGYVVRKSSHARLVSPDYSSALSQTRQALAAKIGSVAGDLRHLGSLRALTLGDRSGIARDDWQRLTHSGTNHLFAISGLHIGLVATLVYFVAGFVWRAFSILQKHITKPTLCWCAAIVAASGYAALAGFSLTTQRALIMLLIPAGYVLVQRRFPPLSGLGIALLLVLVLDPLAPLGADFLLSFGAVAIIFMHLAGRVGTPRWLGKSLTLQIVIALGLAPLLIAQFGAVPTASGFANLLAVPWVGLLVVPTALFSVLLLLFSETAAAHGFALADWLIGIFWLFLETLETSMLLPNIEVTATVAGVTLLSLAVLLLLLPRGAPILLLCATLTVASVISLSRPEADKAPLRVIVLDVGQGLSVLVQTANKTLLYDTGSRFSATFDAGSAVIVPALKQLGIHKLDALLVSHGDLDHRGGVPAVLAAVPVTRFISGAERDFPVDTVPCNRGQSWQWDNVTFSMLSPASTATASARSGVRRNNRSCVLKVEYRDASVLLPGDIEEELERQLLAVSRSELASDILIAPHHGSATSSSVNFIRAVAPQHVVYTVGYRNRFGFPRPEVDQRYFEHGVRRWRTDHHGAVVFEWLAGSKSWRVYALRNQQLRFWHHKAAFPAFTAEGE